MPALRTSGQDRVVYSVEEFNQNIAKVFAGSRLLNHVWIKGEITESTYYSKTDKYFFSLKGESAVINCSIYSYYVERSHIEMKKGITVCICGKLSNYAARGTHTFFADNIEKYQDTGALFEKIEQMKKKLEGEGLFAPEHKRGIPYYVKRIGVVTSKDGKVIQDIYHSATARNPYVQIVLYSTRVQGKEAPKEMIRGLRVLQEKNVDVIIIGRGGGTEDDIATYNDEALAREVYGCKVPVISALGHSEHRAVIDLVADVSVITPTDAGYKAVQHSIQEIDFEIAEAKKKLQHALQKHLMYEKNKLLALEIKMGQFSPEKKIEQKRNQLLRYRAKLKEHDPAVRLDRYKNQLSQQKTKLDYKMKQKLEWYQNQRLLLEEKLLRYSPYEKMAKGFAYVQTAGKEALRGVDQVKVDDEVTVYLKDGTLKARIVDIEKS